MTYSAVTNQCLLGSVFTSVILVLINSPCGNSASNLVAIRLVTHLINFCLSLLFSVLYFDAKKNFARLSIATNFSAIMIKRIFVTSSESLLLFTSITSFERFATKSAYGRSATVIFELFWYDCVLLFCDTDCVGVVWVIFLFETED